MKGDTVKEEILDDGDDEEDLTVSDAAEYDALGDGALPRKMPNLAMAKLPKMKTSVVVMRSLLSSAIAMRTLLSSALAMYSVYLSLLLAMLQMLTMLL